jgi:hypothetical protein
MRLPASCPTWLEKPNLLFFVARAMRISQVQLREGNSHPLPVAAAPCTFSRSKQSSEGRVADDELSDPFGEPHLAAALPRSSSALGLKGAALLVVFAILLLVVRRLVG